MSENTIDKNRDLIRSAATALFEGNTDNAEKWLHTPRKALDGLSPMDYIDECNNPQEVLDLIGRLEQGVFS